MSNSAVFHPNHYGGENNPFETIKVIEAWELGFHLGNAIKYISRAGKKESNSTKQDLEKACWYIERYLNINYSNLQTQTKKKCGKVKCLLDKTYDPSNIIKDWKLPEDLGDAVDLIFNAEFFELDTPIQSLQLAIEYIKKYLATLED